MFAPRRSNAPIVAGWSVLGGGARGVEEGGREGGSQGGSQAGSQGGSQGGRTRRRGRNSVRREGQREQKIQETNVERGAETEERECEKDKGRAAWVRLSPVAWVRPSHL